ncbi:MAG: glucosamine-6-phosphate deaminase, partial [Lachnospiraceae bacterium]|nr:glucosamine-6-phosphate deaminase [Lachnospiraceae bacterium]
MRLINGHTIEEASRITADIFAGVIREKPDAVLGLATGSTPIGLYEALTDDYRTGLLDFSRVSTINLDEYVGLSRQHEQSFGYFMDKHFFSRVNIPEENIMLIDGNGDPDAQADRYEAFFDNRSIDVLILGIGNNGHIGFNEPESVFRMKTHRVALVESTIEANSRFFASK